MIEDALRKEEVLALLETGLTDTESPYMCSIMTDGDELWKVFEMQRQCLTNQVALMKALVLILKGE